jgi:hypothetical protein
VNGVSVCHPDDCRSTALADVDDLAPHARHFVTSRSRWGHCVNASQMRDFGLSRNRAGRLMCLTGGIRAHGA